MILWRLSGIFAIALLFQYPGAALSEEPLDRIIYLDIPANTSLEDSLIEWGAKAGFSVMMNTDTVAHHVTPEVRGRLSARKALSLLLRDSGLIYTQDGDRIRLFPSRPDRKSTRLNSSH